MLRFSGSGPVERVSPVYPVHSPLAWEIEAILTTAEE